jgi:hypothetical protein
MLSLSLEDLIIELKQSDVDAFRIILVRRVPLFVSEAAIAPLPHLNGNISVIVPMVTPPMVSPKSLAKLSV